MKTVSKLKKTIIEKNYIRFLKYVIIFFWFCRLNKNEVLCCNFFGKGYGDNAKYIAEELLKDKQHKYVIYWICNGKEEMQSLPQDIIPVKKYSLMYFYKIATAKYWIFNERTPVYYRKRNKQVYIQTWHGSLAFKKIEYDVADSLDKNYIKNAPRDTKETDLMISNCNFCSNMYRRAFKYGGKILECGSPRNDILINTKYSTARKKVEEKLSLQHNSIVVLYAPTFRSNYDNNPYDIDFEKVKEALEKKYNKKVDVIIRMHPGLKNYKQLIKSSDKCIDATAYPDIQELILASNILVTDYSSTMFEAMISDKPVILYTKDISDYNKDRGSYFEIEELPFYNSRNNKELINIIKRYSFAELKSKYDKFEKRIQLIENGTASKEIRKYIVETGKQDAE